MLTTIASAWQWFLIRSLPTLPLTPSLRCAKIVDSNRHGSGHRPSFPAWLWHGIQRVGADCHRHQLHLRRALCTARMAHLHFVRCGDDRHRYVEPHRK